MLHKLFPQFRDHLRGQVPGLGTIDLDTGQLAHTTAAALQFPAVFIDLENVNWRQAGNGVQKGPATLRFTVALKTAAADDVQTQPQLLEQLEVVQRIHKALQDHQGDGYGPLVRTNYHRSDPQHAGAWCLSMGYVAELVDQEAAPVRASDGRDAACHEQLIQLFDKGGYVYP